MTNNRYTLLSRMDSLPSDAAAAAAATAATDGRVQHAADGSTHAVPNYGPGPDDATAAAAANGLEPAAADCQQHVGQPEGRPSAASHAPVFHGQQPDDDAWR